MKNYKLTGFAFGAMWIVLSLMVALFQIGVYAEGERMLIPIGKTVGITAELGGISVVNTSEFENSSGEMCSPAEKSGIFPNDTILKIDGKDVTSAEELEKLTAMSEGREMVLLVRHGDETKEIRVSAEMSKDDEKYRLGVWIKDSASGIGTLTYYDPETNEFGALGHGICTDDSKLITVRGGRILSAEIASVRRGEKGVPGELIGIFSDNGNCLGDISANSDTGVYGKIYDAASVVSETPNTCPVASRDDVSEGDATILANIEGLEVKEYSAEIVRINKDEQSSKGMIIKITDERLLEKTGGIVRGMSGSPIVQNGKLVGAITHVFVNDPTRGYGIFIDNMIAGAKG